MRFHLSVTLTILLLPFLSMQAAAIPFDAAGFEKVISIKEREAMLAEGNRNINLQDLQPYPDFALYPNPFVFEAVRYKKNQSQTQPKDMTPGKQGPPDDEILKTIISLVNPTGYMIRGDYKVLIFDKNKVAEGESFIATVNFRPYIIVVESINKSNYILRLNKATISKKLGPATQGTVRLSSEDTHDVNINFDNPYIKRAKPENNNTSTEATTPPEPKPEPDQPEISKP